MTMTMTMTMMFISVLSDVVASHRWRRAAADVGSRQNSRLLSLQLSAKHIHQLYVGGVEAPQAVACDLTVGVERAQHVVQLGAQHP